MIGKIKNGANFKGVLLYNEKENAEIIAKNMAGENQKELTKEFILGHELNPRVEKPVKHHILSFSKNDELDPDKLQSITQDYLNKIGYSNNQYVSYLHTDTDNPHLHIVVNKVNMDGKNTHLDFEKRKSRNILMELEKKYNLTRTREQATEQSSSYDKTYAETQENLHKKGKKTDKEIIKDSIKQALEKRPLSEHYFSSFLKQQGIDLIKKGRGYQFEYNGRIYKASNIDRKYSFAKLNKFFEDNYKANEDRKHRAEQYNTPEPKEKTEKQPQQKQEEKTQEPKQTKRKEKIYIPSKKEQHREHINSLAPNIAELAEQRKLDYRAMIDELSKEFKQSLQAGFNYSYNDYMNRVKNLIATNLNEIEASRFKGLFDDTLKGNKLNQEQEKKEQKEDKSNLIDNQDLTPQNKNKNKNKGLKL